MNVFNELMEVNLSGTHIYGDDVRWYTFETMMVWKCEHNDYHQVVRQCHDEQYKYSINNGTFGLIKNL